MSVSRDGCTSGTTYAVAMSNSPTAGAGADPKSKCSFAVGQNGPQGAVAQKALPLQRVSGSPFPILALVFCPGVPSARARAPLFRQVESSAEDNE